MTNDSIPTDEPIKALLDDLLLDDLAADVDEPEAPAEGSAAEDSAEETEPEAPPAPQLRLRLVKVEVKPTFVLDDGTTLVEASTGPETIAAPQWDAWSSVAYREADLARMLTQPPTGA